jgi:rare lipoprotein A
MNVHIMQKMILTLFTAILLAMAGSPATAQQQISYRKGKPAKVQYGTASYYHDKFNGRKTANGEIFSQEKMTCAHNTLPLGTWIRVTNLRNQKTVIVRVTDRLHPKNPRLVDLSKKAAKKLAYTGHGLTKVKVEVLSDKDLEIALASQ